MDYNNKLKATFINPAAGNHASLPLISCLCVTYGKPLLLKRAIACFMEQTYPRKELVIVVEYDDLLTRDFLENKDYPNFIKVVTVSSALKKPLGELRNISVQEASGEYVCQWDDDDWYNISRLEKQYEVIRESGKAGSILTRWMLYDGNTGKAYISHKRNWEGSLMCNKQILADHKYEKVARGEDTAVVEGLYDKGQLAIIGNMPGLYIYTWHGGNTWNYDHFKEIFFCSQELESYSERIKHILTECASPAEGSFVLAGILKEEMIVNPINW